MAQRDYSGTKVTADIWDKDKLYENFEENPIRFASKQDMKDYCKQKGFKSGALL